jgi:hypothetical protein
MSAKSLLFALHYFRMFISLIATHFSAKTLAKIIVQYHYILDKLLHDNKNLYSTNLALVKKLFYGKKHN